MSKGSVTPTGSVPALMKALAAPLMQRFDYSTVARKVFNTEPLCMSCGEVTEEGADSGCPECVARSVMET